MGFFIPDRYVDRKASCVCSPTQTCCWRGEKGRGVEERGAKGYVWCLFPLTTTTDTINTSHVHWCSLRVNQ